MNLLRKIIELVLPRRCVICNSRLYDGEDIICCGCLLENPMSGVFTCHECNYMADSFLGRGDVIRANSLFEYHPGSAAAQMIYKLKYGGRGDIGVLMGKHAAKVLARQGFFDGVDVIVPVPLTGMRRRIRGYNQSEMVAWGISEMTGVPIDTKSLVRMNFAGSQTRLRADERWASVVNAFRVTDSSSLEGKHILLIDDIFTTGATLSACIREISAKTSATRFTIFTLGLTKS